MFKRLLSFAMAIPLFAMAVNLMPLAVQAEVLQNESLLPPVYSADFSPSPDGKFYDSPEGTPGRMEVAREANPEGIILFPDRSNVDDKVISTVASGNLSKIYASRAENNLYAAFSKGDVADDINTGASGAVDDYCLKVVDALFGSGAVNARIDFPAAYGGVGDSHSKYRFEMDWKWQAYTSSTAATTVGSPSGAAIITFYIGDKLMSLRSKPSTEANDARGAGALYFHDGDNSVNSAFELTPSAQRTAEADLGSVTKSAYSLPAEESGEWLHITIDFDFMEGTIYATIEGTTVKREISTVIGKGRDLFAEGISGIHVSGSTTADRRVNFADNIALTPIMTKAPVVEVESNKIMWEAIAGADSYNVFCGSSASDAIESDTPMQDIELDTQSNPGYVIATLDIEEESEPSYYAVTAVSANKGESIKSNVVQVPSAKNIISEIEFEITGIEQSLCTGRAWVDIDAGEGFENNLRLIAAVYDGDTLINAHLSDSVSVSKGDERTMEVVVSDFSTAPTQDMKMKFFLWDANMSPIKNAELSAQEWESLVDES